METIQKPSKLYFVKMYKIHNSNTILKILIHIRI